VTRYFLGRDDDGHWYLVDAGKREEWETWVEDPDAWATPEFARRLGGSPSWVTFTDPEES
jgi:hypothetical protein